LKRGVLTQKAKGDIENTRYASANLLESAADAIEHPEQQ
jgi:hypothetical protein